MIGSDEDMIDSKLHRTQVSTQSDPPFLLEDTDFAPGIRAQALEGPNAGAPADNSGSFASDAGSSSSGHFALGTHSATYADLPGDSQTLN